MNAPSLQFPLCAFFVTHFFHNDIGFFRHYDDLCEGLARPEDVGCAFWRRFEHDKKHHGPPVAQQRWYSNRNGIAQSA